MAGPEYPRPPVPGLDWNNLGFDPVQVNGHIQSHYHPDTKAWSTPIFHPSPYITLHGLTPALNYGQQIFEGLKAFRTPSGTITLFRPEQNAARFAKSAAAVSIPAIPEELFLEAVKLAVGLNSEFVPPCGTGNGTGAGAGAGAAMYIRPVAFAVTPCVGLALARKYLFCVFVMPVSPLHGAGTHQEKNKTPGVKALVIEDFDRAAPRGTGAVKVGGNYGPVLGKIDAAKKEGYGLTLHLDSRTNTLVDEFSTSGFIGLLRNATGKPTLVVSDSAAIVPSITVDSVCQIARSWGWGVERRAIPFSQVGEFAEVYAAGTAAMLVPVQVIERWSTEEVIQFESDYSDPTSGFAQLYEALAGVQQGLVPDQWGWTQEVLRPDIL
ncbi:aminotransferase [Aspergillus karnatakaensis]|uniref:aminotransferase n=1 Tax=Aspergillus karnatakaensis TaxID=1810916 RepID=UPI003CCDDA44